MTARSWLERNLLLRTTGMCTNYGVRNKFNARTWHALTGNTILIIEVFR